MPTVRFNEIFRQARQSMIIVNAHRVNSGQMPTFGEQWGLTGGIVTAVDLVRGLGVMAEMDLPTVEATGLAQRYQFQGREASAVGGPMAITVPGRGAGWTVPSTTLTVVPTILRTQLRPVSATIRAPVPSMARPDGVDNDTVVVVRSVDSLVVCSPWPG